VTGSNAHLVVEDSGLARLGLGDQGLVEDVKNILADLLELEFDLLAVFADDANVLVRALLLLLLLDRGDDAPGGTAGTDDVLVGDREEVALVDGEFTSDLCESVRDRKGGVKRVEIGGVGTKVKWWEINHVVPWQLPVMLCQLV